MTARVYWARIALVISVALIARVADAQIAQNYTTSYIATQEYLISRGGWLPPDKSLPATAALAAPTLPPVVMYSGMGGSIIEHKSRFWDLERSGAAVEMRSGCWSACTLITSYLPKDRLCFAPGAFLAFHAAFEDPNIRQRSERATRVMFDSYPREIKRWIEANGGYEKLTVESYWTMYDRELWAFGYPKCR
jgi:hypothetical protein